jgi:pimeloyl-ACP methyl ester carboxylesterase
MLRSFIDRKCGATRSVILAILAAGVISFLVPNGATNNTAGAAVRSLPYEVGITRCVFVDSTRTVLNYASTPPSVIAHSRVLATEIRYPTSLSKSNIVERVGAVPAMRSGGFPVVVFAHGFNVTPDTYAPLLDAWVRRGFVVVAPIFPDENPVQVARQGGSNAAYDLWNEPVDIVFVTRQVVVSNTSKSKRCPLVKSLINPSQIAVVGHSDGGTVVGMLALSNGKDPQGIPYPTLRAALHFRGAIVLSAKEDGVSNYQSLSSTPSLLVVQSAADRCNAPSGALTLYRAVHQRRKWFLELLTAHHLPPFDGADVRAFNLTVGVTTRFLHIALEGSIHSPDLLAYGNSQPTLAHLFHAGRGPVFAATSSTFYCGTN